MATSVAHIFGSEAKVRIMRLFIFNPSQYFAFKDVVLRTKEPGSKVRQELRNLTRANLIRKRGRSYFLNPNYVYRPAVENFLIDAVPMTEKDILRKLSKAGNMKLVLISGVFMHDKEARADMLVVGDHLRNGQLVSAIARIEAELGKEIRYAAFETPEFRYRLGIYDKLIRDILDHPHQKIVNKLEIA